MTASVAVVMLSGMDVQQVAAGPANEYAELKRQIHARGLLNRQSRYFTGKLLVTATGLVVGALGLLLSGDNIWLRITDAVFLAFVFGQIGLLAHDLSHQQIVGPGKRNAIAGLVLGNLLLGVSRAWWRDNHDAHHAHPNDLDQDPNLQIYLLGCTPEQALERPAWVQWIVRHQVRLLVPIFCLEFFSMHEQSIE